MEDNENWRDELDIGGFSLIDEDDSLLFSSSFLDTTSYEFSGNFDLFTHFVSPVFDLGLILVR